MPKQIYRRLAIVIALTWTLLPVYWLLRLAFMRVVCSEIFWKCT